MKRISYWIRDRACCENGRGCRRDTVKASEFFGKVSVLVIVELNGGFGSRVTEESRRVVEGICRAPAISEFAHAFTDSLPCTEMDPTVDRECYKYEKTGCPRNPPLRGPLFMST